MEIPRIKSIEEGLRALSAESFTIGCVNWPEQFPGAPQVSFGIAHTGTELLLRFKVRERHTLGTVTADNGPVWTDSCVEFFLSLDETGYYNFELNCIGSKLLGFRKEREKFVHADAAVMDSIKTFPSLGRRPVGLVGESDPWTLDAVIPATALFRHTIRNFGGLTARANFYKCGDNLPEPHFLSFAPIQWPKPDFHLEQFFIPVRFAE